MTVIKTVDLLNDFTQVSDWLKENKQEKNIVLMTEIEANELARAKRNLEYMMKLDKAVEDLRENGGYEFNIDTRKFNETPQKANI